MNAMMAPTPARLDFMDPIRESVIAGMHAYIAPVDKPVIVYIDNQVSQAQMLSVYVMSSSRRWTGGNSQTVGRGPSQAHRSATWADGHCGGARQSGQADGPQDPPGATFEG